MRSKDLMSAAVAPVAGLFGIAAALVYLGREPSYLPSDREPPTSDRATLVMYETDWCGWCRKFHEEVVPVYRTSDYAGRVPMRYVKLDDQGSTGYRLRNHVTVVPTFVLMDERGFEVARLRGYPGGPERFFPSLDRMLAKVPKSAGG